MFFDNDFDIFYDIIYVSKPLKPKEESMFDKLLHVLKSNMGYTIILLIAIIFFGYFSDGLIPGLITAVSALLAYACIMALYGEYKKLPAKKVAKAAPAKKKAKK